MKMSFNSIVRLYDRGLKWVLGHEAFTLGILLITIAVNIYLLVDRAQRIFPSRGHRQSERRHPRFPGHFVSGDGAADFAIRQYHQVGSRGGDRP